MLGSFSHGAGGLVNLVFLLKRRLHFESSNEMTIPGIKKFFEGVAYNRKSLILGSSY